MVHVYLTTLKKLVKYILYNYLLIIDLNNQICITKEFFAYLKSLLENCDKYTNESKIN